MTVSSSGVLSWLCVRWRFVLVAVTCSGVLLPLLSMNLLLVASACPPSRLLRSAGALLVSFQSCLPEREEILRTSTDPCPQGIGSAEAKCCCSPPSGDSRLNDCAYSRVHRTRDRVPIQVRSWRDTNWNTLPSPVDDVYPDSTSCGREYMFVTGGEDCLRPLELLEIPHAVP